MTEAEMKELEQLRAENAKLKAQAKAGLKFQVAPKGGVMLIGLRAFPTTFYTEEWTKIFNLQAEYAEFVKVHQAQIAANLADPKESKNKFRATG